LSKEILCVNEDIDLFFQWGKVLQPYFWKSAKMIFTLLKWGLESSLGLPKLQSSIAGVKTPYIEVFLT
jgi:hypothetical protein